MLIRDLFKFLPKPSRPASYGKKEGQYPFFTSSNTIDKYVDVADYDGEYLIIGDGGTANCKYYFGKFSASDHNYVLKPLDGTNCKLVRFFLMKDNYKTLSKGFKGVGIKNVSKTYIQNIKFSKSNSHTDDEIVGILSEIEQITGNTPSRSNKSYYGDAIEWIKTDNIISNQLYPSTAAEYLSSAGLRVGRSVEEGSILMACIAGSKASIGRVCITDRKVAFNQQINAIVPLEYDPMFLYVLLVLSKDYIVSDVNMAIKGILSKSQLEAKQFILPPLSLQKEFAEFVKLIDKLKTSLQTEIDLYNELLEKKMNEYFG